jgi:NADH-quinone oxidoreductase subunit G
VALEKLANVLSTADGDKVGILSAPTATLEESHLLAQIAAKLGSSNIDHRLQQRDFSDQNNDPLMPALGCSIAELETRDAILVVGSNLRREAPILAHRVRKAALAGARVAFINSGRYEYHFPVAEYLETTTLVAELAGVAVALSAGSSLPESVRDLCKGVSATAEQKQIADLLRDANAGHVLLGNIAGHHPAFAALRALSSAIATLSGAGFGRLSDGPNSAGASLAGVLPHREQGGKPRASNGLNVAEMLDADLDALVLLGVEPDKDIAGNDSLAKIAAQNFVAALTSYDTPALRQSADLMLPIGSYAESAGTFVNCEGRWQSYAGVANPVAEARPAWKVLRVLGNLLNIDGFDYESCEDVLSEIRSSVAESAPASQYAGKNTLSAVNGADKVIAELDVPIYATDGLVRRATALQLTPEARRSAGGKPA